MVPYQLKHADWQAPLFEAEEFFPKRAKYCVCVLVLNEGERIRRELVKMASLAGAVDIIVADGGSTDGSLDFDFLRKNGVRTLLVKKSPGFLGSQVRMALAYAAEEGYQGFITVDGNDKDDTSAILNFVKHLNMGYDHVQGSRFIAGGKETNTPFSRKWGVKLLHAPLISLAAHFRYTDTTNSFTAYSRKFILDPEVNPFRDIFSRYGLHYYLAIRAPRLGYRAIEIPVAREYPKSGPVPTKISFIRGNFDVLKTLIKCCLGWYDNI